MTTARREIDREASAWLLRREYGLTSVEETQLAAWLETDPRHRRAFTEIEASWQTLDRLRGTQLAARLERELDELPVRRARRAWSPLGGLLRHSWIHGLAAVFILAGVLYFRLDRGRWAATAPAAVTTDVGMIREVPLPDGSLVRLNTATAIEVDFSPDARRIRLTRGEAFFVVAKDARRPFVVTSAGIDIRAVGTEFNVRQHADTVEVLVREGRVRVEDALSGVSLLALPPMPQTDRATDILPAGSSVRVARADAARPPAPAEPLAVPDAEIERSLAWQQRRLVVVSAPLAVITAEFNRYIRIPLVIDDPELAARHFGGTFEATNPETFVDLLASSYGVAVERRSDAVLLRQRR